jgi:dienelactone hydrolase
VPIGACVDYLQGLDTVDDKRIAIASESLGGYYAARAASYEHRLAACVVWGGTYEFPLKLAENPKADWIPNLLALVGAKDLEEARQIISRFTLAGSAERIECPILILHGDAEDAFTRPPDQEFDPEEHFNAHSKRIYDDIRHDDKTLIRYPIGGPGANHCQQDSLVGVQDDIGDWLEDKLKP